MSRRTYNDLKLANIMINQSEDEELQVTLIDYGFADKYINEDGTHISNKETVDMFQGNLLFASNEQLNFKRTSRKDDMVSIIYLMMYLINNNQLPLIPKTFYLN